MIIETRFRDIPWEEARKCFQDGSPEGWARFRGSPIKIVTPQLSKSNVDSPRCSGPFFKAPFLYCDSGEPLCVCPHVVEIGD